LKYDGYHKNTSRKVIVELNALGEANNAWKFTFTLPVCLHGIVLKLTGNVYFTRC